MCAWCALLHNRGGTTAVRLNSIYHVTNYNFYTSVFQEVHCCQTSSEFKQSTMCILSAVVLFVQVIAPTETLVDCESHKTDRQ